MTAQLELGVDVEPIDPIAGHKDMIRAYIKEDARLHGGAVSSNRVRRALDGRVPPKLVGQVYRALVREGVIEKCGHEVSDDTKGGNRGRTIPAYRLVAR